jgi:hypothetical protein
VRPRVAVELPPPAVTIYHVPPLHHLTSSPERLYFSASVRPNNFYGPIIFGVLLHADACIAILIRLYTPSVVWAKLDPHTHGAWVMSHQTCMRRKGILLSHFSLPFVLIFFFFILLTVFSFLLIIFFLFISSYVWFSCYFYFFLFLFILFFLSFSNLLYLIIYLFSNIHNFLKICNLSFT